MVFQKNVLGSPNTRGKGRRIRCYNKGKSKSEGHDPRTTGKADGLNPHISNDESLPPFLLVGEHFSTSHLWFHKIPEYLLLEAVRGIPCYVHLSI
jgi:hypothetical protein